MRKRKMIQRLTTVLQAVALLIALGRPAIPATTVVPWSAELRADTWVPV